MATGAVETASGRRRALTPGASPARYVFICHAVDGSLAFGHKNLENIGTSAKENIMAKFFKDPDGKLIAALGNDVATPAGCTELTANTEDAAHEKHVPVVESERDGHVIRARVGSVEHPMVPEHFIEWIALEAEGRLEVHYLQPGMKPATFFAGGSKTGTVYAYCNLHGLWSATF